MIYPTHSFAFDHVYDQNTPQKHIYDNSAKAAVLSTLKGYNATIIAYGQTGTGKTYTMEGNSTPEGRGIIPRSIEDIFYFIENDTTARSKYLVRASYLQIYNEVSTSPSKTMCSLYSAKVASLQTKRRNPRLKSPIQDSYATEFFCMSRVLRRTLQIDCGCEKSTGLY